MDRIMTLRERIMDAGMTNTTGYRHVAAFAESVEHTGWLDETMLAVKSWVMFNLPKLIAALPVGLRDLQRGKLPLPAPLHKKRPGHANVARIFKRLEGRK